MELNETILNHMKPLAITKPPENHQYLKINKPGGAPGRIWKSSFSNCLLMPKSVSKNEHSSMLLQYDIDNNYAKFISVNFNTFAL